MIACVENGRDTDDGTIAGAEMVLRLILLWCPLARWLRVIPERGNLLVFFAKQFLEIADRRAWAPIKWKAGTPPLGAYEGVGRD